MSNGWTIGQVKTFWRAFSVSCKAQGISVVMNQVEYRRRVMQEECGKGHMAEMNRTGDFEKVMRRILSDGGDYEGACRYINGEERRYVKMIEACADQVWNLQDNAAVMTGTAMDYVRAICTQAGYPVYLQGKTFWMDVPEPMLHGLFMMLDTHRRRLLKAAKRFDGSLTFKLGTIYLRDVNDPEHIFTVDRTEKTEPFFRVRVQAV